MRVADHVDAEAALESIQADFLAENYDLPTLLPQHLIWARESVSAVKSDGDPYGLLDLYQEQVELMERYAINRFP